MPAPRNLPARSSQRRSLQQDEPPMRTRSGRGGKSASAKSERIEVAPIVSPSHSSHLSITRKATRSSSNVSNYAAMDNGAPEIYASYEEPLLMVFGLSREFFDGLKKHHGKLPKIRKEIKIPELPQPPPLPAVMESSSSTEEEDEDDEDEDDEEESSEESDVPHPTQSTPRGRGGRGRGRGGRGRGGRGRGRGRGGRGRGGLARTISPVRTRPSRNAAPMFPLTEGDDDDPSNQTSPTDDAKQTPQPEEEIHARGPSDHDEEEEEDEMLMGGVVKSTTPTGSPPLGHPLSSIEKLPKAPPSVPKISLPKGSASHTPQDASTPSASEVPKLLDPEDDVLSDSDLPDPWIEDAPPPIPADCEDRADYLLKTRFKPMTDVQAIIASLTKFPASQRSTENLFTLAANTQRILKAWQDEYLVLDARTAPHAHPPKKPCNGGRVPLATQTYEDMKEADLYGYTFDPKKPPGMQDPFAQRPGAEKARGRELRQRRARDMLDSVAPSEEEEEEENDGRPSKRQRRATRKFDGSDAGTGANTPKRNNGWGGARKRGVSKYAQNTSETPEPEGSRKRARTGAGSLLHQRIQEMREESAVTSSGDEGSSNAMDADDADPYRKRGRPAGSKNVGRRSDYGIKKGPRKKIGEPSPPVASTHTPNPPPSLLQSLSEGQNQFSIDPQASSDTPPPATNSAENVFQATPQPTSTSEAGVPAVKAPTPDTYMNTTPLSQYNNPYEDGSSGTASGSRRKPRVKSEKRSQSMTIWWAERKARQKELEEKNGTPVKPSTSRSNSSTGRRGGRTSTGAAATTATATTTAAAGTITATPLSTLSEPPQPQHRSSLSHAEPPPPPPPPPQEVYPLNANPPQQAPYSAPSPSGGYPPTHAPVPPPMSQPPMLLQNSPLAALPSGPALSPLGTHPHSQPPNSQFGGPRALAPAPMPPSQPPTYPSPYGPRTAPRPKSSGPPPLAPAPPVHTHFSPYPPLGPSPVAQREMAFKVMVPGPPPAETRRDSR